MMPGMLVVHDGEAWAVARIGGMAAGSSALTPAETIYYLQRGIALKTLVNPKAEDVPLLPRCPSCGQGAQPGQHGSPGWVCVPGCPFTRDERAALHALEGSW